MSEDTFEDIVETFQFLEDWEDRYRHIIDMGKAMPDLDPAFQVPATKVDGCASQVWLVPDVRNEDGPRVHFTGSSDAMIVRGLIAILRVLYSGQKAETILATDAAEKFAELGLDQHLSAQRSNGLRAMVERIRNVATQAIDQ